MHNHKMYSSFTHNLLCSLRDVVEYYLPLILSSLGAYFEKSRTRSNRTVLGLTKCFVFPAMLQRLKSHNEALTVMSFQSPVYLCSRDILKNDRHGLRLDTPPLFSTGLQCQT